MYELVNSIRMSYDKKTAENGKLLTNRVQTNRWFNAVNNF